MISDHRTNDRYTKERKGKKNIDARAPRKPQEPGYEVRLPP